MNGSNLVYLNIKPKSKVARDISWSSIQKLLVMEGSDFAFAISSLHVLLHL